MIRKTVIFSLLLCLTACGFRPMYGNAPASDIQNKNILISTDMSQIRIGNIPDREGQILRNLLVDRFYLHGIPQSPRYQLDIVEYDKTLRDLDITIRSDATRRQMRISARIELIDLETDKKLFSRPISGTGSYNILASQYTTRVSRTDVEKNILNDLAAQTERQIVLFLNSRS